MKICPRCGDRYRAEAELCMVDRTRLVDPFVGHMLDGRYRIDALIGRGRASEVFRARCEPDGRPCAIKVADPHHLTDDLRGRFGRVSEVWRRTAHPTLVEILGHGSTDRGEIYLAMELVVGESLEARLGKGPLALPLALRLMTQLAAVLAHVHDRGEVHGKLSWRSVFVTRDDEAGESAKLFHLGAEGPLPSPRAARAMNVVLVEAAPFLAPEPAASGDGGERGKKGDLYALGVLAYAMVTGRLPFEDVGATVFNRQLREPPTSPTQLRPLTPPALDALLLSLLAKDPAARPRDAHEVAATLAAVG